MNTGKGLRLFGVLLLLLLAAGGPASGFNVRLSQIDSSRLLLTQVVRIWVSVTDQAGQPLPVLTREDFTVAESADGEHFRRIEELIEFKPQAAGSEGIAFLLLIDNSGSMYDTLDGRPTQDSARMRITQAKAAVRTFLGSMTGPADTVGLVAYNTNYTSLAAATRDKSQVAALLDGIRRPGREEAYTELYAALTLAAREFQGVEGRKAIVILSDGENFPYFQRSGQAHPIFAEKTFEHTEPILACLEEGVSVYAVNFAPEKDRNLQRIALESGGTVFDARSQEELTGVYRSIHRQVAGEYLIAYRATMEPADRKYVQVEVRNPAVSAGGASATRFYFSSTAFGQPAERLGLLLLLSLLLALVLLWGLSLLKFEKRKGPATLQVLHTRIGRAQTRVVPLRSTKTVIGGGRGADMTIVGNPSVKESHATVIFDAKKKAYTVVGSGELTVNNRPVKTKVLEAGDVIDVGGATIVFDDGEV